MRYVLSAHYIQKKYKKHKPCNLKEDGIAHLHARSTVSAESESWSWNREKRMCEERLRQKNFLMDF